MGMKPSVRPDAPIRCIHVLNSYTKPVYDNELKLCPLGVSTVRGRSVANAER